MKNNKLFLIFGLVIFIYSCQPSEDQRIVVATAYDYNLYLDDLEKQMPNSLTGQDSIVFAQNFINHWMQEKTMLHFANENLIDDDLNISDKIEKYKNSLLIYNYQKQFIQQNLDTIVSETEIYEYYKSHQNEFVLKDNIVKVIFIKFDNESRNIKEARNLLKKFNSDDLEKLQDMAERFAINYFLDQEVWLLFDDLIKEVPIQTYNQENFLKNNKYVEITDSLYTTLALINGFRTKESISPLSFEQERIRMIILNKRKQMLLEKLENDIMEKAREDGALVIINQ